MTKEKEILDFLSKNVFDPILNSPNASETLKRGVRYTIMRLSKLDAKSMRQYFWSAIVGTPRSIGFAEKMEREGFKRFESIFKEFRKKFNEEWLRSKE